MSSSSHGSLVPSPWFKLSLSIMRLAHVHPERAGEEIERLYREVGR